ncbi:hypothetical protein MWU52_05215 [Jannaschia sp. S6380]|uniref:DUF1127 domain-containing protein n=1 Tax=Jannaschia sp. S6380 TaxID=2926408 RepID=UPI001FF15D92|nr:hypothetical protein [Jannaschia sp. S6380]MCK0166947.1 hypothetical protein [Jannaschia sp. S6380]
MAAPAFDHPALNVHAPMQASPVATFLMDAGATLARWETRARTRQVLRDLDPLRYGDLGLTTAEVLHETTKPFWRA